MEGGAVLCEMKDFGTMEPGKPADLVVLQGDPLTDITMLGSPFLVIKNGKIVD